jgi:hypothetical protein
MTASTPAPNEPADRVAAAVRAVPGVADLHPGMFGEVGTYLPGRRVPGIRIDDGAVQVHICVVFGASVRDTRRCGACRHRRAAARGHPHRCHRRRRDPRSAAVTLSR